jgi:hypothetical protein
MRIAFLMSRNDRKCDEMRFTNLKIYYGLERTRLRGLFRCTRPNCASLPSCKTSRRWRSEHQASERTVVRIVCVRAVIKRIGSKTKGMSYLI